MKSTLFSKISIGITFLILVVGIGLGSRQLSQISQLREQIDTDDSKANNSNSPRRRILPSSKQSAAEIGEILAEMEPYGKDDSDLDKRYLDAQFKVEIASLSSSQSEETARELLLSGEELSKSEIRVVRYCLLSLADENPQAALELIKSALDHPAFPNPLSFRKASFATLLNLGSEDLQAVHDWFASPPKTANPNFPIVEKDKIIRSIFEKKSLRNYDEAFALLNSKSMEYMNKTWAMYGIHESLSLDRAKQYLTAIRNSKLTPLQKREAFEAFAKKNFAPNFEAATSWIESQNLEYQEFRGILNGLSNKGTGDLAEWITWVTEDSIKRDRFSGAYESAMKNLLSSLVREDFVKAGQLINSLPGGSKAKEYARGQYANHMSGVNLEVAIEWFDTLPNGKEKTKTGRDLLQKYHRINPTLAEEFAIKNKLYVE